MWIGGWVVACPLHFLAVLCSLSWLGRKGPQALQVDALCRNYHYICIRQPPFVIMELDI